MKKIATLLILGLIAQGLYAQTTIQTEKLNDFFERLTAHDKFMGSVSVAQNGKTIYSISTGFADVDAKIHANGSTKYKIGSISKTFTSVMVFQTIEAGKLSLEQTLDTYFPEIENAGQITIAHLLGHRSGIRNYLDNDYLEWSAEPKSEKQMLELIVKGGSEFKPDSAMGYSNSNYMLLSYILEKIHKKNFGKILEKQITKPLKLKNTYLGSLTDPKKNESRSYTFFDRWRVETDTHSSVTLGAGGIISTPDDLNVFFEALFTGKLISYQNLEKMRTIREVFGLGLLRFPFYDRAGYGHTGGIDGFSSVAMYFPSDNLSYSLVSNGANYVINNISLAVLSAVYEKPFELPDFQRIALTTEELEPYLGTYSTSKLPIKITFTKNDSVLIAQGTGQPSFALEAVEKDKFTYEKGGIIFEFQPEKGTVTLKQGGGVFLMERE